MTDRYECTLLTCNQFSVNFDCVQFMMQKKMCKGSQCVKFSKKAIRN